MGPGVTVTREQAVEVEVPLNVRPNRLFQQSNWEQVQVPVVPTLYVLGTAKVPASPCAASAVPCLRLLQLELLNFAPQGGFACPQTLECRLYQASQARMN